MKYRVLSAWLGFVLICMSVLALTTISEGLGIYTKEVLVLHSYQRDYYHTRALEEAIEKTLGANEEMIRIRYEYLDTKNHFDADVMDWMCQVMQEKYNNVSFDGIILTDDDALVFYKTYGAQIWPSTKHVVATGINSLRPYGEGIEGLVIMEERPNVEKTIELALNQNKSKGIENLHFVYDNTTTSNEMRVDIQMLVEEKFKGYKAFHHYTLTPEELKQLVSNSGSQDLFVFVLYSRDRNDVTYLYDEVPKYVFEDAKNPVYALWEFYLGTGVIGGHMASSYKYGEGAANILLDLWEGKVVPPLIFETGDHQAFMFDYQVLNRHSIDYMPKDSIFINRPISYFERNKWLILSFILVVSILVLIIVLMAFGLRQKHMVNDKNYEISRLNNDIIETQKDLIARLGDVIETRSHETASHVKRVASISAFIAEKHGLNHEEVLTLKTVSPMHDVGKIGITENILHKPGKLTEKEFEIMKYHTTIGYEILKNEERHMLKCASIVALEHHERWDGNGYPHGKRKEDIHIFARITAIVDVYDALRSDRVYKKAWSRGDSLAYILEERGKFFDPDLVDLFVENIDAIEKLREHSYKTDLNEFNAIYAKLKDIYS